MGEREVERAQIVCRELKKTIPEARVELNYSNPLELMVATVLAAQSTDVKVNEVTAGLFKKYQCAADYVAVEAEELEKDIRSTGFYRQKAKNIRAAMAMLIAEHDGQVPGRMDALTCLPGIGRKSANVILGNVYGVPGIVVDTHVGRVSRRLGLTAAERIRSRSRWLWRSYCRPRSGRLLDSAWFCMVATCARRASPCAMSAHSCHIAIILPARSRSFSDAVAAGA